MFLLSVVIPTRNRQKYAIESVKQILSITDERVQIVVTDNSNDNSLKKELEDLSSDRIKYEFFAMRIPGVDNYAKGIELSDGKYVCCIGDDDGVLRQIVYIVDWMDKNNIQALKPGVQATYIWPNAAKEYPLGCVGLVNIDDDAYIVNPQKELEKFLKSGCIDFPNAKLVKAYHGIVRQELFQKIYKKTGKYCGGLSPDIYLSVSLSLFTTRLVCIDLPLTIFGACKASTTADSLNKINTGKLEDAPHFVGQEYEWSSLVPRYYCGSNIWADSALHAVFDMKEYKYAELFALDEYTAYSLLYYRKFKNEIMTNYRNNKGDIWVLRRKYIKNILPYCKTVIKERIRRNERLITIYRAIRERIQKKAGSEAFMKIEVDNVAIAEKLLSVIIERHVNSLNKNLQQLEKVYAKE